MKKELDEKLCADYPELFKDRHANMHRTAMCWGFECDDGWYGIIDQLCKDITKWCKEYAKIPVPVVMQVKEKFGGLCFYISRGDDEIYRLIHAAENQLLKTCEVCGNPGKPRGGGWIRTLCDEHAEGREGLEVVYY